MEVGDIPEVYHLGNQLFHGPKFTTLYRKQRGNHCQ
jgi:hypothetical protein